MRGLVERIGLLATKGRIICNNAFVSAAKNSSSAASAKGNSQDTVIDNNLVINCDIGAPLRAGGTRSGFFRDGTANIFDLQAIAADWSKTLP